MQLSRSNKIAKYLLWLVQQRYYNIFQKPFFLRLFLCRFLVILITKLKAPTATLSRPAVASKNARARKANETPLSAMKSRFKRSGSGCHEKHVGELFAINSQTLTFECRSVSRFRHFPKFHLRIFDEEIMKQKMNDERMHFKAIKFEEQIERNSGIMFQSLGSLLKSTKVAVVLTNTSPKWCK